jgi:putative ABC transport system substrate-binding protein
MMHGHEKSDSAIVAVKLANKVVRPAAEQSVAGQAAAEPVERRAETKGNADQQSTRRTQSRASVSQALDCMRQALAVWTRGRSRMRESCTYGSVRGALSNERPYRDRRTFIAMLGGSAAWPIAAQAQQPVMPVIGFLSGSSPADRVRYLTAFRQGVREAGYVEGQNVAIEYRWAQDQSDRLPDLAADLVRRQVTVIAAHDTPSAIVAKAATTTIPIVFASGGDPVKLGLVASLNRPGGNVTGVTFATATLGGKSLGLLHELLPGAVRLGALVDPNFPFTEFFISDVRAAASTVRKQIEVLEARTGRDIDMIFASLAQKPIDALLVGPASLFNNRRVQLVTLATYHRVPAIYFLRDAVEAGGLMSYGASLPDAYRQAGVYVGRLLKGEKPADLPVMQSIKFEFVINLNTAKVFGFSFPPGLLALADEVIE